MADDKKNIPEAAPPTEAPAPAVENAAVLEQPVSVSAAPCRVDLIVDIRERLHSGKGASYARWAKVYNLKQMAALQFMQEQNITEYDQLSAKAEGRRFLLSLSERTAPAYGG